MSSPLALVKKGTIRNMVVRFHQKLSHNTRVDILVREIGSRLIGLFPGEAEILCLDVGCGDMKIAEGISEKNKRTVWSCLDVYDLPGRLYDAPKWTKYKKFDGAHIPLDDKSVDVVLFCDVLHHAGERASDMLNEAGRVGRVVIVKDHFEYALYSRIMLKTMDFIGNWGYGVQLPESYFTPSSFEQLYREAGLKALKIDVGVDLYSHLPIIRRVLRPQWHFIAVLSS